MHVFSTLVWHVVLVLMVLPKFLSLIPFWRASPALVLECYEEGSNALKYVLFGYYVYERVKSSKGRSQLHSYPRKREIKTICRGRQVVHWNSQFVT